MCGAGQDGWQPTGGVVEYVRLRAYWLTSSVGWLVEVLISDFTDRNERTGTVRCPDLLGALVVKAAATTIPVRENPARDWQDAALLLSVLADPLGTAARLNKRDRQHLDRLRPLLGTSHCGWENLSGEARRRGATALSFLID